MTNRETFLNYVKNGGRCFCSPQIGSGAGFDTKSAGKEWISETTLEDTLKTVRNYDMIPLINIGCPFESCAPEVIWEEKALSRTDQRVEKLFTLKTPKGILSKRVIEDKKRGFSFPKHAVTALGDLDAFEYCIDALNAADFSLMTGHVHDAVNIIGGEAALDVQWPVQPYELLTYPGTVDTVLLAYDDRQRFIKLMDKIVILDEKLMKAVSKGGADFIFLGGPGSEMLSPRYYEEYIIPYSRQVTQIAHDNGLLVYSHICSPVEPFLTMGFYNRMGIDLFETLSPPPAGNVRSLRDALEKTDPRICTRGNIGLDVLLNSGPETVREKVYEIIEQSRGSKHIVAASDYLFYGTPEDNVKAMCDAASSS